MTPEGKVKKQVSAFLNRLGYDCYYYMPVQTGYGKVSLDYVGVYKGKPFAIETKAPGGSLTPLQETTKGAMERAGMTVFVVVGTQEVEKLFSWFSQ